MSARRIAVLGGGVVGICSAVRIQESLDGIEVTLISDKLSPYTTGDGSAGFIMPYSLGPGCDQERIRKWTMDSMDFLHKIAVSEDSGNFGVAFLQAHWISNTPEPLTDYPDILVNSAPMTQKQLSMFPSEYKFGLCGTGIYAECSKLLPQLMERFKDAGGEIRIGHVSNLEEVARDFDVVVNCTGIGSAKLVPDALVYPVRGQVIKVRAPWIKHAIITPEFHVLPTNDVVTLGGTKQKNNWNTDVDAADRDRIWNGCCKLVPSIKTAEVLRDWVGLRPTRDTVRLEGTSLTVEGREVQLIHNYGHGGSGVTLAWGCAGDVVQLIKDIC